MPYRKAGPLEPYPVLRLKVSRSGLERPFRIEALVDTGFDGALIISRRVGMLLKERQENPDGLEEIDAGGIGIPCDLYHLEIFLGGRWFRVKAHLPQAGDFGNIVGRILLNRIRLCLRGPELFLNVAT